MGICGSCEGHGTVGTWTENQYTSTYCPCRTGQAKQAEWSMTRAQRDATAHRYDQATRAAARRTRTRTRTTTRHDTGATHV